MLTGALYYKSSKTNALGRTMDMYMSIKEPSPSGQTSDDLQSNRDRSLLY